LGDKESSGQTPTPDIRTEIKGASFYRNSKLTGELKIVTANVNGSREAIDWLCCNSEADVLLIQEHKLNTNDVPAAYKKALFNGWRGVWTPAKTTSQHKLSRSGGLATLVRRHVLITQTPETNTITDTSE